MGHIEHRVIKVVARELSLAEADVSLSFKFPDGLDEDSLEMAAVLVMALESEFDVDILDVDAEKLTSVQLAVEYFERALTKA